MKTTPLEDKIATIIKPVIEDLGFALVCVKIVGESKSQNVQVMAENPDTRNLGVDDAAKISRAISAVMDVEDPISGAYRLEVSSPGIDRPLITRQDFENHVGYEAKLEIAIPAENGQKKFRGRIESFKDDIITINTDQGIAELPYPELVKAKLVLTDELIKATAKLHRREDDGTVASC